MTRNCGEGCGGGGEPVKDQGLENCRVFFGSFTEGYINGQNAIKCCIRVYFNFKALCRGKGIETVVSSFTHCSSY